MQLGLRFGELCALTWDCVDMNSKRLHVRKSAKRNKEGGVVVTNTLKSTASQRSIAINDYVISLLEDLRRLNEDTKSPYLFVPRASKKRDFYRQSSFEKNVKRACENIIGIRFLATHTAGRKTMGTILAKSLTTDGKLDPFAAAKVIQKRLGHAHFETTIKHYIVPALENEDEALEVFNVPSKKKG
jgi:integrase